MLISELNTCFCPNFHIGWTYPRGHAVRCFLPGQGRTRRCAVWNCYEKAAAKSAFLLALNAGMCYVIKVNESRDLQNFCPAAAFISSGRLAIFSPMESMQEVAAHGRMN